MFAFAGHCFRLLLAAGLLACRIGAALGTFVGKAVAFALNLAWQAGKPRPLGTTSTVETAAEIARVPSVREPIAQPPPEFTPRPLRPRARKRR